MTRALRTFSLIIALSLISRGIDYGTGSSQHEAWPPNVWALACILTGVAMATSAFSSHWRFPYTCGIVSFAVYFMIAFQMFEMDMLPWPWPPNDNRFFIDVVCLSAISLGISLTIQYRESVAEKKKQKINAANEWLAGEVNGE